MERYYWFRKLNTAFNTSAPIKKQKHQKKRPRADEKLESSSDNVSSKISDDLSPHILNVYELHGIQHNPIPTF